MKTPRRVLLVDDDPAMVRTLTDVLRLHDWEVETARSGEEAVAAVEERPFTVILMDIRMEGISGVEALKEIRSRRPDARVVLMTAYTASHLIEEAEAEGAVDILSKPVVLPHLLDLLEREAELRRTVLVVDDDPDFLRGLCDALESQGVRTHRAESLHAALHVLDEESGIGVVLLDLRLNGLVGRESVLAIRELRPEVLVVLFSGYPRRLDQVVEELPEGCIVDSLIKPFDPRDLLSLLEDLDAA